MSRSSNSIPKASDHMFVSALEKLSAVPAKGLGLRDYLEYLDQAPHTLLDFPCLYSKLIVAYERLPILFNVFNPKPRDILLSILGDAQESPFLMYDAGLSGPEGLFIVMQGDLESNAHQVWIDRMRQAKYMLNTHPRFGILFAGALTSFPNAG